MSTKGSVSCWLQDVMKGDELAAQRLWQKYFDRLVNLARRRLRGSSRAVADEEDVAIVAFHSFCRAAKAGRYPRLADRDDLWKLLVVLTAHKALDQIKYQRRQRRGGNVLISESKLERRSCGRAGASHSIEQVVGREPTPQFAALVAERLRQLIESLRTETQRNIALWKLEGYRNEEVAARLCRSLRDVERQVKAIRDQWQCERKSG